MGVHQFDPLTANNEIGVYWGKSRRVTVDIAFGEVATWIKSTTAGIIVWENGENGEVSVIEVEAGESLPLVCTRILSGATIDGTPETTTATGMFWITTPQQIGKRL